MSSRRHIAIVLLLGGHGCQPVGPSPTALPDLTGLEVPVARRLQATQAEAARSGSAASLASFARVLHAHAMLAPAERAYLAAAALSSDSVAADNLHLAGVAASETDLERALRHVTAATGIRPDHPATEFLRGRYLEALERHDKAEDCYRRLSKRTPSSHALLGLGRVLLAKGDAEAALSQLDQARRLAGDHREVHEALARCLARLGRTSESRTAARRAGDMARPTPFPDQLQIAVANENVSSEARLHRGAALARAGQVAAAIANFEGVLEVRKEHTEALDYLTLLVQDKQPRRALSYLDRILRQQPRSARALELRARLKLRLLDRSGAERDLRQLLLVAPNHGWARKQLRR